MAWLKAYQWEHTTFPREQGMRVRDEFVPALVRELGKHYGLRIGYRRGRRGGRAFQDYGVRVIRLEPNPSLGLILHELAHHIEHAKHGRWSHHSAFKTELVRLYSQRRISVPAAMRAVIAERKVSAALARSSAMRLERQAIAAAERKAAAKSTGARIEKRRAQVKRLERRIKSLSTRLRNAKRSLLMLERSEASRLAAAPVAEASR